MDKNKTPHFDIDAAVVFRLGDELITDTVQALLELVKNSYDADATWVKLTIDTQARNEWGREYSASEGVIRVEDDGDGMTASDIRRGWLTIANSPKRAAKEAGETTRRGRTPIGDKGLGRLGVQKLARNVEIITRPRGESVEHYVAFSWEDFRPSEHLSRVPVVLDTQQTDSSKPGTTLILSNLLDDESWQSESYLQDLQRKLSGMISPFEEVRDFLVFLEVDGKRVELAEVAQRLRETALLRYRFEFDGEVFRVRGMAQLAYLQPSKKEDQDLLRSLCRADEGKSLFEYLDEKAGKRRPAIFRRSETTGWFVEFGTERKLIDIDKVRVVDREPANPGPFRGEVDSVSLELTDSLSHVMDKQSDYRRLVRDLSGVRVYRDGFGIRVGEDWLGLGKQWTRGTSYYGLRPGNVLGYVALTAADNRALIETTSREGFQATPHYENFFDLLKEFVRFSADAQEFLRRGVLAYLNDHRDRSSDVEPTEGVPEITRRIDDVAQQLSADHEKLEGQADRLRRTAEKTTATLKEIRGSLQKAPDTDGKVSEALARLDAALAEADEFRTSAKAHLDEFGTALRKVSELQSLKQALERRWNALNDEVEALYESVSLGLTAEALSHEVHNIADGLARRSSNLLGSIKKGNLKKGTVVAYIEHVRSSVAAMRKQLGHLTPSLRYLRDRRERIEVIDFLNEVATFYTAKLEGKKISVFVTATGRSPVVNMNKGKLTQVFDNLILNSEYWLIEAIRTGIIQHGEVEIVADGAVVTVSDNGRGVEPTVEGTLFDPFVTTKSGGQGRGLGLFVVRQLLDSESCSILLLPDKNSLGRRYRFEIDLSGAVCD